MSKGKNYSYDPSVRCAQKSNLKEFEKGKSIFKWDKDSTVKQFGRAKVLKAKYKKR